MKSKSPAVSASVALSLVLVLTTSFAHAHGRGERPRVVPFRLDARATEADLPNSVPNDQFVNFETPHVSPLDLDGTTLVAVNTPDNRLEVFDVASGVPVHTNSIPVGFDPVSCRFNPAVANQVWVVNHVSDSISVVDLAAGTVVRTIHTGDEPADVVFTDYDRAAFDPIPVAVVSCSRIDTLQIFALTDSTNFDQYELVESIFLDGEDPRALAIGSNGDIFAAIFESGNNSTLVPFFESVGDNQAVKHPSNPYGGQTPPFNNVVDPTPAAADFGTAWVTPHGSVDLETISELPPPTSVLVKKDALGAWRDDNGKDWTVWLTGAAAPFSGRFQGWDMMDNDIASIAASSELATNPEYATGLMNLVMAIGVNPVTGSVVAVGTDGTNEIRFEPNVNGTFNRVLVSVIDPATLNADAIVDLNEAHLAAAQEGGAYDSPSVDQSERNKSIGDPRGIAFSDDGARIYVTGMGSNNVIVLDGNGGSTGLGERIAVGHTINVGQGPTGIVYDSAHDHLYVLNKFDGSITTVDAATPGSESVINTQSFFDPTPVDIKNGRPHFYDTHRNSGLGQVACASCHVDGKMDRLAWDLGDPLGTVKPVTDTGLFEEGTPGVHNLFRPFGMPAPEDDFDDFHPMKGPMTTQTLQDIIGKEPHHWRGDRDGIEEFAGAWPGLQGADAPLDVVSMQEFEDFLASIEFAPNPFRAIDNTLPGGPNLFGGTNPTIPIPGHFATGRFASSGGLARGTQLPAGDAWRGMSRYVSGGLDAGANCVDCHTLPTGAGSTHFTTDTIFGGGLTGFLEIPPGPNGEAHLALFAMDGTGENAFKTPHIRNQMDKEGFYMNLPGRVSRAGFGVLHDGSIAGLAQFIASNAFAVTSDQDLADLVAFNLAINGGFNEMLPLLDQLDTPVSTSVIPGPPGGVSNSAHAAVGRQITLRDQSGEENGPTATETEELAQLLVLAEAGHIDLVASGIRNSAFRSFVYSSGSGDDAIFNSDLSGQNFTHAELVAGAGPGTEITYLAVPEGLGHRLGRDRDLDGILNNAEQLFGSDTGNAIDHIFVDKNAASGGDGGPTAPFQTVAPGAALATPSPGKQAYLHIAAGTYPGTHSLTRRMRIVGEGGIVRIGAN